MLAYVQGLNKPFWTTFLGADIEPGHKAHMMVYPGRIELIPILPLRGSVGADAPVLNGCVSFTAT